MPALQHLVAHLYTDDTGDTKDVTSPKRVFYVAEGDSNADRGKKGTVTTYINLSGLAELACGLDVQMFMTQRPTCQWIKFLVYIDDALLPEVCCDHKYNKDDIERSGFELLSPIFTLKEGRGQIQLVVKTGGPGKKWPDFTFHYEYRNSTSSPPALLCPIPTTRSEVSRRFRDVEKKREVLLNRVKELQFTAEDRKAKERLLEEEETRRLEIIEQEKERRLAAIEQEKQRLIDASRVRRVSWNTSVDHAGLQNSSEGLRGTEACSERSGHKRRPSFDERFEDLCREASQPVIPKKVRKGVTWNDKPAQVQRISDASIASNHRPQVLRDKRTRLDAIDSGLPYSDCISPIAVAVCSMPAPFLPSEADASSVPPKPALPVPLMKNKNLHQPFNHRRGR